MSSLVLFDAGILPLELTYIIDKQIHKSYMITICNEIIEVEKRRIKTIMLINEYEDLFEFLLGL